MCTYTTERCAVAGSGKGPQRWTRLATATVYYDHPVHAPAEHTLNIDLAPSDGSPADRVALELPAATAVALAATIVRALAAVPEDLTGLGEASQATLAALETALARVS